MFEVAPCLHEIVECARSHFSCGVDDEISLKGRVDCGRGRAAYALVDLKTDVEWDQFKRLVEQASVPYLDVVVTSRKTAGREGDRELVPQLGVHLPKAEERAVNQLAEAFGPNRMVYDVRSAGGTSIGGESHGGRHYRVDLTNGSYMCNVPTLLHLPCSHVITPCRARGLDYKSPTFMSPLYRREHTIKIWESSFEPYFDPSRWPPYHERDYVPNSSLKKDKKGRRQKKSLKGDMDASQGRFAADYETGDFDEDRSQNHCSKCHKFIKDCKCRTKKKRKRTNKTPRAEVVYCLCVSKIEMSS
ncbi:hypothetical protein HU200_037087 [Digitaria exilis]|uniref:SWIM-type domain-containing protein n=1 Tax=Digitaria exilis TaxID=1010633 RepID=A0A835BMZ8_9POAL|nr:hypothetical protein HU200_037087 [Digitaria exilis]